jgi:hypothetical protein
MNFDEVLARPEFERLRDWASIGPVQKAVLMDFIDQMTYADDEAWAGGYDEGYADAKHLYSDSEEFDK